MRAPKPLPSVRNELLATVAFVAFGALVFAVATVLIASTLLLDETTGSIMITLLIVADVIIRGR